MFRPGFDRLKQLLDRRGAAAPAPFEIEVDQQLLERDVRIDLRVVGGVLNQLRDGQKLARRSELADAVAKYAGVIQHIGDGAGEADRILDIRPAAVAAVAVQRPRRNGDELPGFISHSPRPSIQQRPAPSIRCEIE